MTIGLAISIYILNIYDYILTSYFVYTYGTEIEMNPFGQFMLQSGTAMMFKILLIGIMLIGMIGINNIVSHRDKKVIKILSCLLFGVYSALATYHTILYLTDYFIRFGHI